MGDCYPADFVGPVPDGSTVCAASTTIPTDSIPDSLPCYPDSFSGPLPPSGVYCSTGTGVRGTPASTSTSPMGISTSTWVAVGGVLLGLMLLGGRR